MDLEKVMNEYTRDWISIDERSNLQEKPYMQFILPNKYAEVLTELHREVDKTMRVEYELLRQARCKDLKIKYKKPKTRKRKGGKVKRKTKRLAKDLTAEQPIESLIAELGENGILFDVPKKSFDDFIGDYNFLAYELRNTDFK